MKKLVAVILSIVICITLASCSQSIGIIGGSDGETNIYVSEK